MLCCLTTAALLAVVVPARGRLAAGAVCGTKHGFLTLLSIGHVLLKPPCLSGGVVQLDAEAHHHSICGLLVLQPYWC